MKNKTTVKKQTPFSIILKDKKMGVILLLFVLVSSILFTTFAWYQSQVSISGSTFNTGSIGYIITGFDESGNLVTTIKKDDSDVSNDGGSLFTKNDWSAESVNSAYLVVENIGSLDMEYKISFSATGDVEYLGGFWYALTEITDKVGVDGTDSEKLIEYKTAYPQPKEETDGYNMATMSRYSTYGVIEKIGIQKRYYRLDYGMCASATSADYTSRTICVTPTIFVTQKGAIDNSAGGYIYNCSNADDIKNARDVSLPGDSIRLMNNIIFEGDLVFNKATNIITNNYSLTVEGNLIYDFSSPKDFVIDVTGNGALNVKSPAENVGGNFFINTPSSNVTVTGSGSGVADISIDGKFSVNATRAFGEAGATFTRVKIVDSASSPATIFVEDDTRVTVSENTVIARVEVVEKAKFVEVKNAGTINTLVFSGMNQVANPNSPQIYVVNMGYIVRPIELPTWSVKFVVNTDVTPYAYQGNTKIVQTVTGNRMTVTGAAAYTDNDIEKESTNILVAPVDQNDGELIVYYQNIEGQGVSSIQDLLEKYFNDKGEDPVSKIAQITRLDIISIGDKAVDNYDISYLKSLSALSYLDLSRATVYDSSTSTVNKLCNNAFLNVTNLKNLILPQNLEEIGSSALANMGKGMVVTIPGSVTKFGSSWYRGNLYVAFSASTPPIAAYNATNGMENVQAIFVEEFYIDSYKNDFVKFIDKIFPMAQLDDTEVCFVRQIPATGEWEIVYYIGEVSNDLRIGGTMRLGGNVIDITGVGDDAFKVALKNSAVKVAFSDGIKYIGAEAFAGTKITAVSSWGASLGTIEASAFAGCSELSVDVYLPQSMVTIEEKAFSDCTKLTGINTGGTAEVKSSAFLGCTSLVWVDMPEVHTLEQLGSNNTNNSMFYKDSALISVKLPSLEKSTGLIFNANNALREIVFGNVVYEDIAESGCTSFYKDKYGANSKIYFNTDDTSAITIANVDNNRIYPAGEKYGELVVNGYNIGKFIYSDTFRGDGVTVITGNSLAAITGEFVIPGEINGSPVTEIGRNAFSHTTFTSATVYFPDSLKVIGDNAFYKSGVKAGIVGIGSWGLSLETIGKYAFSSALISGRIVLPENTLESIGDYAFANCQNIVSINTGSAKRVGARAFEGCRSLVIADLPHVQLIADGNTSTYCYTFKDCTSLAVAKVPSITSVTGEGLFYNCDLLYEIYMGNSTPVFGSKPFGSIAATQQERFRIYVPEDYLATYRSTGVGGLKYCIFPNEELIKVGYIEVGTESYSYNIGAYVLQKNGDNTYTLITSNVNSYTGNVDMDLIPELEGYTVTKIGSYAFTNYKELTSSSAAFSGQRFSNVNFIVGSDVTEIGDSAFRNSTGLISVDLRNTEIIGQRVFQTCKNLLGVNGCNNITDIGSYAFYDDISIKSIYFENLQSVGNYSFRGCTALTEFIINKEITPESVVPTYGSNVFQNSNNVTIYVPLLSMSSYGTKWATRPVASFDDTYEDASGSTYILQLDGTTCIVQHYLGASGITSVTVPNTMNIGGTDYTVVGINKGAFNSIAASLTTVTLPSGFNSFSSGCLSEITNLSWLSVADGNRFYKSVNGIVFSVDGGMLVKYPRGLANAEYVVPDNVYAIGEYAFEECTNLTSVVFGENLMVIDSTAFVRCRIANVTFGGTNPPVMMGAEIFDITVPGFAMNVPAGSAETYVKSMNFVRYAPFINSGTEIPAEGLMNLFPWSSETSVAEYVAMPPEMPAVKSSDEEEDPAVE